jgi:hypothetical protein
MSTWKHSYFKKRLWLNSDPSLRASLLGRVELSYRAAKPDSKSKYERNPSYEIDAVLTITDCDRTITLDFDVYGSGTTQADLRERRAKMGRLVNNVVAFGEAYLKALDAYEAQITDKP